MITNRENILRTIRRDEPTRVPHRYDGAMTLLRAKTIPRAMQGGLDDWGLEGGKERDIRSATNSGAFLCNCGEDYANFYNYNITTVRYPINDKL